MDNGFHELTDQRLKLSEGWGVSGEGMQEWRGRGGGEFPVLLTIVLVINLATLTVILQNTFCCDTHIGW